ncbi:MAG: pyridoxamine 5'-phosphate oxidase family protein [Firmicutes bacterium]|nr:pyridoxamine 5'-phosphate oxidase family protein [Bacillota bacterium]
MSKNLITKAEKIVKANTVKNGVYQGEVCVMTLIDEDGYPSASVITPAKADGIKSLWFASNLDSQKVAQLKKNNRASVCFCSDEYSVSLTGEVKILTDTATKKQLWYKGLEDNYEGGINDPLYCVLHFVTKKYDIFLNNGDRTRGEIKEERRE